MLFRSRLSDRRGLLESLDGLRRRLDHEAAIGSYGRQQERTFDLLTASGTAGAFDIHREPDHVVERYGRTVNGTSLLMARRLVEAGVQFVAYNAFNQEGDTHGGLLGRYKQIVPPMDKGFAALVADLADRGLLERTLVVNTGEFGRTPTVNNDAGRDHWPNVYTTVLAGGGTRGGVVHGASDAKGAEPADAPVSPADLLATLYDRLGIPPSTELRDRLDRPLQLSDGRVLSLG